MRRKSIELDVNSRPVPISGRVLNELCAHARETQPEECCGLIVGDAEQRYQRVVRCRNEATHRHQANPEHYPRDGREAFFMNELDYVQVQEAAEASGHAITAVYHSHIGAEAYLSSEDRLYAEHPLFPFPNAAQIVLSVLGKRIGASAIFEVDGGNGGFEDEGGRELEVVEP